MRGGGADPLQRPQEVILCCRRNNNTWILGLHLTLTYTISLFCGAEMDRSTLWLFI